MNRGSGMRMSGIVTSGGRTSRIKDSRACSTATTHSSSGDGFAWMRGHAMARSKRRSPCWGEGVRMRKAAARCGSARGLNGGGRQRACSTAMSSASRGCPSGSRGMLARSCGTMRSNAQGSSREAGLWARNVRLWPRLSSLARSAPPSHSVGQSPHGARSRCFQAAAERRVTTAVAATHPRPAPRRRIAAAARPSVLGHRPRRSWRQRRPSLARSPLSTARRSQPSQARRQLQPRRWALS
mmetsp:Transcript_122942/g.353141  ORF Transcript_122942/g.353141 Transcript_122942/m.353141 type:complete len:240 (+) Transcript_122942:453-1172(+)